MIFKIVTQEEKGTGCGEGLEGVVGRGREKEYGPFVLNNADADSPDPLHKPATAINPKCT